LPFKQPILNLEAGEAAIYQSVPASSYLHHLKHLLGAGDDIVLDSLVQ
jgi:O-acetylhomoserine/O-acetylserine sulfhydrylase-like pyridoxal-dependent enzyme